MRVQVAFVGSGLEALVKLDVPADATVAVAIAQSGLGLLDEVKAGRLGCAVFGRRVDLATPLADDDRVEITRPLVCDPKLARRRRAAKRN